MIEYRMHIDGIDKGSQHNVMGAGFTNVTHFKKRYNIVFMRVTDFSLITPHGIYLLINLRRKVEDESKVVAVDRLVVVCGFSRGIH